MADKEIFQFTPNDDIQNNDLIPFSNETLPGHISSVIPFENFLTRVAQASATATSNIYVSSYGSDLTGSGSFSNPYLTLDYAISQITPSASAPVNIILSAEKYNVLNLEIKPFVYILGNNAEITVDSAITVSAEWGIDYGETLNFYLNNCTIITGDSFDLDFSSFTPSQSNFISFNDVNLTGSIPIVFFGNGQQFINFTNCGNLSGGFNVNFSDIGGGALNTSDFLNISVANNSIAPGIFVFINGCAVFGNINLSAISTNVLQCIVKSTFVPNTTTVDGVSCVLLTDCNITAIPTLLNNGTWVPLSIASGMVVQYTPVHYDYSDPTVNGYFQGVDDKFGDVDQKIFNISYSSRLNLTSTEFLLTPASYQVYVNMLSAGQSIYLPQVNVGSPTMAVGQKIYFEIAASSNPVAIKYYNGTLLINLDPNEGVNFVLDDNSTPQGTWVPEYIVRSVNGLSGGAIKVDGLNIEASYTPTNYTPTTIDIAGHLEGINAALGTGPLPGASSYANAGYNKNYTSAGSISFANTTSYLPFLTLGSPASYDMSNLFAVETDSNLHTVFRCLDPSGGTYVLPMTIRIVSINNNGVVDYFVNFGINGFGAGNISPVRDFPLYTYGTTDNAQITQSFVFMVTCAYNDIIYAPLLRSGSSSSPFDTLCKQIYTQVTAFKVANSNSSDFPLSVVSTTSATLATGNRYLCTNGASTTLTLPTTAAVGGAIRIDGVGSGGFIIAQNSGQSVSLLSTTSTAGTGGLVASVDPNSGLTLQCSATNTDFLISQTTGNFVLI